VIPAISEERTKTGEEGCLIGKKSFYDSACTNGVRLADGG